MKKNFDIRLEIETAWSLRLHPKVEECRRLVTSLYEALGLTWTRVLEEGFADDRKVGDDDVRAELICLASSLARADGDTPTSRRLLEALERAWVRRGKPLPYSLQLQKGINAQIEGDDTVALERFLAARNAAPRPLDRLVASVNALLCLEGLGLPVTKVREESLELLGNLRRERVPPGVVGVLRAFELRNAFRSGELTAVFAGAEMEAAVPDRTSYFRLWAAELPYHRYYGTLGEGAKEGFSLADPHFYLKSYRLRTLQGRPHPEDESGFRVAELADRFYLWTWRWLATPNESPLERVTALLPAIAGKDLAHRLTTDDFQLLRNALLWLSLFDPAAAHPIERLVQRLRPHHAKDFPLLELERLCVGYLMSLRDARPREAGTRLKALKAHPLFGSPHLYLPRLVTALGSVAAPAAPPQRLGPLEGLYHQLRALLPGPLSRAPKELVLDLSSFQIRRGRGKPALVSAPICLGFELLRAKESVDSEEFLRICFGLPTFDPGIHPAKIYNLLSRMRACAPRQLRLSAKGGRIHASGDWSGVEFKHRHPLAGALQDRPEWKALVRRPVPASPPERVGAERWVRPALALKKLKGAGRVEITRNEIERLTGKSKSTTQRIIQRWLDQGVLKRSGSARSTRYTIQTP